MAVIGVPHLKGAHSLPDDNQGYEHSGFAQPEEFPGEGICLTGSWGVKPSVAHSIRNNPLSLWQDKVPFTPFRVRVLVQNAVKQDMPLTGAAEAQGGKSPLSFDISMKRM